MRPERPPSRRTSSRPPRSDPRSPGRRTSRDASHLRGRGADYPVAPRRDAPSDSSSSDSVPRRQRSLSCRGRPRSGRWARQFASLLYWSRYRYLRGSEAASALARRCAPSVPSVAGVKTSSAPYALRIRLRSLLRFAGTQRVTRYPSAAPSTASAIPVFPEVASRRISSFVRPARSAARTIPRAARSLTLPPGLCHSAFAYRRTPRETCAVNRSRGRSGVSPMRSATREAFGNFAAERMRSNASGPSVRLLAEGEFEHVKGEEGALQPDGTQRDAEFLQHRVLGEAFGIGERHPLHHRREHRCARLTDRATLALELHLGDSVGPIDLHMEDDLVPAQRVRVPGVLRGAGERALVPRVLVVVQDLFLINVVRDRHQAKTSWTFLMPATSASASSMSL